MARSNTHPIFRGPRLVLLGLFLLPTLNACFSRPDSLAPILTITDPQSGTTRTTDGLAISGFAMDDEGIAAIRVDGTDLLTSPAYEAERGKKLVNFRFSSRSLQEGELTYRIEAEDLGGRTTTLSYRLQIDITPPTLELSVTPLDGGRLRIEGVARDNNLVSSITIAGAPLQFIPAGEYTFALDVEASSQDRIEVIDSAGNRISQPLR